MFHDNVYLFICSLLHSNRGGTTRTCISVVWPRSVQPTLRTNLLNYLKEVSLGSIPQVTENDSPVQTTQQPSTVCAEEWHPPPTLSNSRKRICDTWCTIKINKSIPSLLLVVAVVNKLLMTDALLLMLWESSLWDVRLPLGILHLWVPASRCYVLHHRKHSSVLEANWPANLRHHSTAFLYIGVFEKNSKQLVILMTSIIKFQESISVILLNLPIFCS